MMSDVDLMRELIGAQADHRGDEILVHNGVADPDVRLHCGLAKTQPMGKFYEPHDVGEYAVIVPVMDDDELVDLIAFDLPQPDRWWLRRGDTCLLGAAALDHLYLGAELQVRRNPLSWLQNHTEGCVVLDWPRAADRLRSIATLDAADIEHGQEIRCHLQHPLLIPEIRVPESIVERAA